MFTPAGDGEGLGRFGARELLLIVGLEGFEQKPGVALATKEGEKNDFLSIDFLFSLIFSFSTILLAFLSLPSTFKQF